MEKFPKPNQGEAQHTYEPYNRFGREYVEEQRSHYGETNDLSREFIERELAGRIEGKVVADVGCGAGDDLQRYIDMGASEVVGVEPSKVMRGMAEETLAEIDGDVTIRDGEFEKLPLEDDSVDTAVGRFSFHIQSNLEKSFKEVARVLKPGGFFLVIAPHPDKDAWAVGKEGKEVGDRVEVKPFNNEVIVNNGTHSMDEYLGNIPSKYFDCIKVEEQKVPAMPEFDGFIEIHLLYQNKTA